MNKVDRDLMKFLSAIILAGKVSSKGMVTDPDISESVAAAFTISLVVEEMADEEDKEVKETYD